MSKKSSGKADKTEQSEQRRIKSDRYKSFKLQKRIKPEMPKLPNVWRILKTSLKTLFQNWKVFGGITLIYSLLNVILVHGFAVGAGFTEAKQALDEVFTQTSEKIATSASLFLELLNGGDTTQAASVYQFALFLLASLVLIWTLRQVYAKNKVRIRDGFYRGMYPLVPFVLVLVVVGLQLLPAIIGAFLYGQVTANGIAATTVELVLWGGVFTVLAIISLYMVSSSIFALYIVCLPDMTPLNALRSARNLVRHRRWAVLRKVVFLPIVLILAVAAIVIPLLLVATPVAPWAFLLLNFAALAIMHSYMYELYRSLL